MCSCRPASLVGACCMGGWWLSVVAAVAERLGLWGAAGPVHRKLAVPKRPTAPYPTPPRRLSALERANTAQATAMLSCLEESERVRLQQLSLACESPLGPLAEAHVSRRSEFTDDSSAFEVPAGGTGRYGSGGLTLELPSEVSGSFVTCLTPGTVGSSGLESIFHSVSASPAISPDPGRKQQQAQQQQAQQQRAPSSAGSRGSARSAS